MSLLDQIHGGYVYNRRVRVLSAQLAPLLPPNSRVLDVGCGDGLISRLIMDQRPDVEIRGIDVLVRPQTHIPVEPFNGEAIPRGDASFDAVLFVDVLHHTRDPKILLREAARVARQCVLIKDHNRDGLLAGPTLRFMDWVGNARHGVVLPYNYWPARRWTETFASLGLAPVSTKTHLGLYPWPAAWVFGRQLHFLAKLEKKSVPRN
jgi:SAM-dependent methyltransferase